MVICICLTHQMEHRGLDIFRVSLMPPKEIVWRLFLLLLLGIVWVHIQQTKAKTLSRLCWNSIWNRWHFHPCKHGLDRTKSLYFLSLFFFFFIFFFLFCYFFFEKWSCIFHPHNPIMSFPESVDGSRIQILQ